MQNFLIVFVGLLFSVHAAIAANVGNWVSSSRSWNQAEFSATKAAVIAAGNTVEADETITAANLGNDQVLVIGEATVTPTSSELADLSAWVSAGGRLIVLVDTVLSGTAQANSIMTGLGLTMQVDTSSTFQISPSPVLASEFSTSPNLLTNVGIDTSIGYHVINGGTPLVGNQYAAYQKIGAGYVFLFGDRLDHNFAGPNNQKLFVNLVAFNTASLTVTKTITPASPSVTGSFPFTVTCDVPIGPSGPTGPQGPVATTATYSGSISVSSGNTGSTTIIGIAAGSTNCVVAEGALPPAPVNYAWGPPTYTQPPATALVAGTTYTASITNPLVNILTTVSGRTYVEMSKPPNQVDNGNGTDLGVASSLSIACSGPNATPAFNAGPIASAADGTYSFSNVPAGANCTITQTQPTGYTNAYTQTGLTGNPSGVLGSVSAAGAGTTANSTISIVVPLGGSTQNNFAEQSADMSSVTTCPLGMMGGSMVMCTVTCTNSGPGTAVGATCSVRNSASLPPGAAVVCSPTTNLAVNGTMTCSVKFIMPFGNIAVQGGTGALNDTNGGTDPASGNNPSGVTVTLIPPVPLFGPLGLLLLSLLMAGAGMIARRRQGR